MKASSARRIAIGIGIVLASFTLLMVLTGDPEASDMLRYTFLAAITVGGAWWLGYHYRVLPRRESFAAQARELGLRAEPGDPLGLLDRPFRLFTWSASARELENTAYGLHLGVETIVADYWFSPTNLPEHDDHERYTCVLTSAPVGWADVSVVPERPVARLRSSVGLPDVRVESEEFNRRFEVRSEDRRFALALLDARMMRWLLDQQPGVGFEVLGGRVMVFRRRTTTSVDDLARVLEVHAGFWEQVPRVVRAGPI